MPETKDFTATLHCQPPTSPHSLVAGFVKADVVPNGERVAEGPRPGAGGDGRPNGPLPPLSPPAAQGTSPPVSPQSKEPSQGVAAIPPPMLEKSGGASAEGPAHKGDALQSLRLSMPMQETELCKHTVTCICSECPPPVYFNHLLLWDVASEADLLSSPSHILISLPVLTTLQLREGSSGYVL